MTCCSSEELGERILVSLHAQADSRRTLGFSALLNRWRDYDTEDTMRFYALRLHEAGMIKSTPAKIIGKGTDWRFFNEVRRELKT